MPGKHNLIPTQSVGMHRPTLCVTGAERRAFPYEFPHGARELEKNHLHWIAQSDKLNKDVQRFKSFTARSLIDHLSATGEQKLLEQLAFYKKAHKQDRDYQVWEEGSHPQLIQNEEILRQKLDYMHLNPVKRGYVDKAEHWRYSSARNYLGMEGLVEVCTQW